MPKGSFRYSVMLKGGREGSLVLLRFVLNFLIKFVSGGAGVKNGAT